MTRPTLPLVAAVGLAAVVGLTGCGTIANADTGPSSTTSTAEPAEQPALPTEAEVMAVFDEWNASLATGDPEKVVEQYTEDAILLPTVAGEVHDTPAEKEEYFTEFLTLKPKGTWVEPHVRVLGPNAAVLSGLYDFAVTRDGKPETINARGTFVFERINGEWQITEHHSSKKPV